MNRQWQYPGIALGLIILTGVFLNYWKGHQKLGKPGLQVVELDESGKLAIEFPETVLDYAGRVREVGQGTLEALPADTTIDVRFYRAPDGFEMQLMGVLMGVDRTSIHQPQFCLTGIGFNITETVRDSIQVEGDEPYDLPVLVLKAEKDFQGTIIPGYYVYWFVADGLTTPEHWERMWWMAKGLFSSGELQRWAYVSCFGIVEPGQDAEATLARMKTFLASAIPTFQHRPSNVDSVMETVRLSPAREPNVSAPLDDRDRAVVQ